VVNDDLLSPLESESFSILAMAAEVSVDKATNAGSSGSFGQGMTIRYDAATQCYFIKADGATQTFGPGDLDGGRSSSRIATYIKLNGSTGESLVLTKPGTSGQLTYRYIGAGFWQRKFDYSDKILGEFYAFVYGVETPDADLPRSGTGNYYVDMLASIAQDNEIFSLFGAGTLDVNFATGDITTGGNANQYDLNGALEASRSWTGSAQLRATSNLFEGQISVTGMPTADMLGRFFGPHAEEVGAAFQATNGGPTIIGTLIGREGGP
jgi:hypothetical protein